jgi:glyoxylase-like metal-dependent hydrolase (beta-lactamase superfamily II)
VKIGGWEIKSILAGRFGLDGGAMFGVVPRNLWARRLPPDEQNRIPMAMRCLLARGHGRSILVDVGSGSAYDEKFRDIYGFSDERPLVDLLESAGVASSELTDVVLTHLHFDHGAGVVEPDGDGWRLLFPRASHHVQRTQWEHAFHPNARDRASYFADRLAVMESGGVLRIHDGPWSLCAGAEMVVVDGHSPGQQLPRFGEGCDAVFFCGDLIPTRHHLPAAWVMAYDLDPVLAMEEKESVLQRAFKERWVLFFEHDAHVEGCRVDGDGKRFVPGEPLIFD